MGWNGWKDNGDGTSTNHGNAGGQKDMTGHRLVASTDTKVQMDANHGHAYPNDSHWSSKSSETGRGGANEANETAIIAIAISAG